MYQVCYYPIFNDGSHRVFKAPKTIHYSIDSFETLCGKEINEQWYILTTTGDTSKVSCPKCIKEAKRRGIVMRKSLLSYVEDLLFLIAGAVDSDKDPASDITCLCNMAALLCGLIQIDPREASDDFKLAMQNLDCVIDNTGIMLDKKKFIELCDVTYKDTDLMPPEIVQYIKNMAD